jgi:uncharacterized protein YneF (UPF0154 family)
MKLQNVLIIGGVALVGYWLWKKSKKKVIDINPPMEQPKEEPKTIRISMSGSRRKNRNLFPQSMYSEYNTSKSATVAPAMVTIS